MSWAMASYNCRTFTKRKHMKDFRLSLEFKENPLEEMMITLDKDLNTVYFYTSADDEMIDSLSELKWAILVSCLHMYVMI